MTPVIENATRPMSEETASAIEDALRVGAWSLLGRLLAAAPDEDILARLRGLPAEAPAQTDTGLPDAWAALRQAAFDSTTDALAREYHDVFVGIAQGEVVPYASYYRSGVLMDKALVQIRQDLIRLGLQRSDGVSEPEDHAAAVCEGMAMVIHDDEIPFAEQKPFFEQHIEPWMGRFFGDLRSAPSARFYRAVGQLGDALVTLERRYLSMLA